MPSFGLVTSILIRFHDILIVALLTTLLCGANFSLIWAFEQDFVLLENPIDIPSDLSVKVRDILRSAQLLVLALSAIVAPFGIYHALLNAHLTLPVRLLAASENLNKFFYAIVFLIYNFCAFRVGNIKCSQAYFDFAFPLYKKFLPTYLTLDIAQYSQLGISLSRFLALSFDGVYFRYTLRWPFLQLLMPYLFRLGFHSGCLLYPKVIRREIVNIYLAFIPLFLMCSLDFVTNMKMRKLRRGSVSRAEALLMVQMITNSSIVLANSLFFYSACILINFFFTGNLLLVILELLTLHQFLLYNLLASLISVYCFKKPKEKWEEGERTIVVESYKH